jgi:hypothetical protein
MNIKRVLENLKKAEKGCGFENIYKEVCGKTPNKSKGIDLRYKYPKYTCSTCLKKISKYNGILDCVQEGKQQLWDDIKKIREELRGWDIEKQERLLEGIKKRHNLK